MKTAEYVHLDLEQIEDESARAFAHQANETARMVAEIHGMLAEIYQIFEQFKPLMGSSMKLPPMPVMPPGMAGFPFAKR